MLKHEDEIVVRIKDRIAELKRLIAYRNADEDDLEDWNDGYREGRNAAEDDEIDFLVQLLTDFVRV